MLDIDSYEHAGASLAMTCTITLRMVIPHGCGYVTVGYLMNVPKLLSFVGRISSAHKISVIEWTFKLSCLKLLKRPGAVRN